MPTTTAAPTPRCPGCRTVECARWEGYGWLCPACLRVVLPTCPGR